MAASITGPAPEFQVRPGTAIAQNPDRLHLVCRSPGGFVQFALMCPPLQGHLSPMFAIAQRLRERGHGVAFVGIADIAPRVISSGCRFEPVGTRRHPPGTLRQVEIHLGRLRGLYGLHRVLKDLRQMTDMLCTEAPQVMERIGAQAIVCDQLEPAGGLIARHMRLPHVSVANALMIDREPYVPPFFTDWPYARTPWARERNLGAYRVHDWMMRQQAALLQHWCARWGIAPCSTTDDCLAPVQVGQLLQPLDFPRDGLDGDFCYAGPLRTEEPATTVAPAHPRMQCGRPFAYVSLGSLQGGRFHLLARITQACADLGLTALVTHGGRLSEAQAAALPGQPQVHAHLPQQAAMRGASVVVTHGGLNTVLDAATLGIPLVVVPLALEQGAIAQRAVRAGVAVRVPARWARRGVLRSAIDSALSSTHQREASAAMARAAASAGGAERAARFIEHHARG